MRIAFAAVLVGLIIAAPARAAVIPVTTLGESSGNPMVCSLRAAIQAANTNAPVDGCVAGSGTDTVQLGAGTYTLSTGAASENANASGDLDVVGGTLMIAGAGSTTISAQGLDRVLDVIAGTVTLSSVTVTGTA